MVLLCSRLNLPGCLCFPAPRAYSGGTVSSSADAGLPRSQPRRAESAARSELHELIVRLARENPIPR